MQSEGNHSQEWAGGGEWLLRPTSVAAATNLRRLIPAILPISRNSSDDLR